MSAATGYGPVAAGVSQLAKGDADWLMCVGVDASLTRTGVATVARRPKPGSPLVLVHAGLVIGATENQDAHFAATHDAIDAVVYPYADRAGAWMGAIELCHFGRANVSVMIRLAYEHGNARGHLIRRFGKSNVWCYNPKSWRRFFGFSNLQRDAAKAAAVARVAKVWNIEVCDDQAEAICIAEARMMEWDAEQGRQPLLTGFTQSTRIREAA